MSLMYLMRFTSDETQGIVLEPLTRKKREHDLADYCGAMLGYLVAMEKAGEYDLSIYDDENQAPVTAIIADVGAQDFTAYLSEVEGYTWSPLVEGSDCFGYRSSETIAWVFPHRDAPVVFWRRNSEKSKQRVMQWLQYHFDRLVNEECKIGKEGWPIGWDNDYLVTPKLVMPEQNRFAGGDAMFRRKRISNRQRLGL